MYEIVKKNEDGSFEIFVFIEKQDKVYFNEWLHQKVDPLTEKLKTIGQWVYGTKCHIDVPDRVKRHVMRKIKSKITFA